MLPIERKSVEPMAAVTAPAQVAAKHQSLLHFVGNAPWSDAAMLAKVGELVLPAIERFLRNTPDRKLSPEIRRLKRRVERAAERNSG